MVQNKRLITAEARQFLQEPPNMNARYYRADTGLIGAGCPVCGAPTIDQGWWGNSLNFRYLNSDGTEFKPRGVWWKGADALPDGILIGCKKCGNAWPVFTVPTPALRVVGTEEIKREVQPAGSEKRTIDNSGSSIEVERKLIVSRQWSHSLSVEYEKTRKVSTGVNIQIRVGAIQQGIEEQLRSNYTLSENQTNTHTEEITIRVLPNTIVDVLINWKQILAHGVIKLRDYTGADSELPFAVVVGLTFDQKQVSRKQ